MKIVEILLDKIIYWILSLLIPPLIAAIGSRIKTGDWGNLLTLIPKAAWIIFGVFILVWGIGILIYARLKKMRSLDSDLAPGVVRRPEFGWVSIGNLNYAGVKWRINIPASFPWNSLDPSTISPDDIEIEIPPRCPLCETELEESHRFLGGYIWKCVGLGCNFKKRSGDSYYRESQRVGKNAKRYLEKIQNSK